MDLKSKKTPHGERRESRYKAQSEHPVPKSGSRRGFPSKSSVPGSHRPCRSPRKIPQHFPGRKNPNSPEKRRWNIWKGNEQSYL